MRNKSSLKDLPLPPPCKESVSKHLSFPSPSLGMSSSERVCLPSWGLVSSSLGFETDSKGGGLGVVNESNIYICVTSVIN